MCVFKKLLGSCWYFLLRTEQAEALGELVASFARNVASRAGEQFLFLSSIGLLSLGK